jgi:SRSO17 transposase
MRDDKASNSTATLQKCRLTNGQSADIITNMISKVMYELQTFDTERAERLEAYVSRFCSVFQRSDQFLRFRAYLRGLLEPSDRKNVESIAAAASSAIMAESDLAQALQHFVSHSPWDAYRLQAAVRNEILGTEPDDTSMWVVHDGAFPKKGRHSVGVQRQFARSLGRKLNCQLGVFVGQLGSKGYFPLAARLYLPGGWLRENPELSEKVVPEEFRQPMSKGEIALQLVQKLHADGVRLPTLVAEGTYFGGPEFAAGVEEVGIKALPESTEDVAEALRQFEEFKALLGMDHFEGRTWHGWHHHISLVFAAYGFLVSED